MPEAVTTLQDPAIDDVAPAAAASTVAVASDRVSDATAIGLVVAWFVGYALSGELEPQTAHPMPVIGVVLGVAFLAGLLVTAGGLIARRRWGLVASLWTSGLFLAATVACPTTGHHGFGLWWVGQLALSFGLVAASVVAFRRG
jgi:hypothetical protein